MRASMLLLMLCAAPLWAAEVKIPPEVKVRPGRLTKIEAVASDKAAIRYINVHDALDLIESETGRWAIVTSAVPGRYRIAAYSDAGGPPAYCVVIVEGEAPKPPPDPKVDPPTPKPPTPAGGVRVLIVYESAELAAMPEAQQSILFGMPTRKILNDTCEQDGAVKGWRIFDKDVDASADTKGWADLLRRPRASVPWVIITRGGTPAHEGPLPADAAAFAALLAANAKGGK